MRSIIVRTILRMRIDGRMRLPHRDTRVLRALKGVEEERSVGVAVTGLRVVVVRGEAGGAGSMGINVVAAVLGLT